MQAMAMDFFDKLTDVVKNAADMANDSLEMNKLISDANLQRGNIEVFKRELGEFYLAKYDTGEKLDEEAMFICDKIMVAREKIDALEAELAQIKADREAEKAERKAEREERRAAREAERKAAEAAEAASLTPAEEVIDLPIVEETPAAPEAQAPAAQAACSACGTALAQGQKFCGSCGKPVEA